MNTCKTALRILKSRKMYLVIYLGFIGHHDGSPSAGRSCVAR